MLMPTGHPVESGKSTTGYVVLLCGTPVIWESTKQTVTALSAMETEHVAISECSREPGGWGKLMSDSQAAIAHAKNPVDKNRIKHISIRYHFVREKIEDGTIEPIYVPSCKTLAAILTKPLSEIRHKILRDRLLAVNEVDAF
ncbi:LOW QUALITY PROTEIN: hypothetical protein M514_09465, partial [Trichuris suis]